MSEITAPESLTPKMFRSDSNNTKSQVSITIYPFDDGKFTRLSVYQGIDIRDGKWEKATVSWPSIGSVAPEVAAEFADAIKYACFLAAALNEKNEGKVCPAFAEMGTNP